MKDKGILVLSIVNLEKPEDVSHATALFNNLEEKLGIKLQNKAININDPNYQKYYYDDTICKLHGKKIITLFIGQDGKRALQELDRDGKLETVMSYNYLGTPQYEEDTPTLEGKIDHLLVPVATLAPHQSLALKETKFGKTLTLGVPNICPSREDLKKSYDNWQDPKKPSEEGKYIVIMLPGDAPDNTGRQRLFTTTFAAQLVMFISRLWENHNTYTVLVHNSPRTGKHNTEGQVICDHSYDIDRGETAEKAIDMVSKFVIDQLEKFSTEKGMNFQFFPFVNDRTGREEVKHSLLHLARQSDNYFVIPGESASDLEVVTLHVNRQHAIVFKSLDAMNDYHRKVLQQFIDHKYVSYFGQGGKVITPTGESPERENTAFQAAHDIAQGYKGKFSEQSKSESKKLTIDMGSDGPQAAAKDGKHISRLLSTAQKGQGMPPLS